MKFCAYLLSKKIPRKTAAKELDVSVESIRLWVSGERLPREEQMLRIYRWSKQQVQPNDFYDLSEPGVLDGLPLFNGHIRGRASPGLDEERKIGT